MTDYERGRAFAFKRAIDTCESIAATYSMVPVYGFEAARRCAEAIARIAAEGEPMRPRERKDGTCRKCGYLVNGPTALVRCDCEPMRPIETTKGETK